METPDSLFRLASKRRWFACGGVFLPYSVPMAEGGHEAGCQVIAMMDVESGRFVGRHVAARPPAAWTAWEISAFAREVFAEYGRPTEGVLISPSVWMSAEDLYGDEGMRQRIEEVFTLGFRWPAMAEAERLLLEGEMRSLGLALAWEEHAIPGYADLTRAIGA